MSTLTLVRHGQATSFQRESGILSPLGETQARKLAEFWLQHGIGFDEAFTGTLVRQQRTGEIVAQVFREAGTRFPELRCDAAWNEYDAAGVLEYFVPAHPRLTALAAEFERARGGPEQNRSFLRLLEPAMRCWLEGTIEDARVEPWSAFRERLSGALCRLREGPPGRRVAVFTSGGPIGFTVQKAMKGPPESFLDVNWRVRNCSITEFVFDRERLTLDSFNGIPHLAETALRSYR